MNPSKEEWKTKVKKLCKEAQLEQLTAVLRRIPNIGGGERQKYWDSLSKSRKRTALMPLVKTLAVRASESSKYSTLLFPSMIGRESAPNFWLFGERDSPDQEELWKSLYLLLSSVVVGNVLINLDNVGDSGREKWRTLLQSEAASPFVARVRTELGIRCRSPGPFYLSLLAISYFVYKLRESIVPLGREIEMEEYFQDESRRWGLRDDTVLILFQMGRTKKEVHYFARIIPFIARYFKNYLDGKENKPSLIQFIDSLTDILSPRIDYDIVNGLREKFVLHLLKYNQVGGENLAKLVELKAQDILHSKTPRGIMSAREFFGQFLNPAD